MSRSGLVRGAVVMAAIVVVGIGTCAQFVDDHRTEPPPAGEKQRRETGRHVPPRPAPRSESRRPRTADEVLEDSETPSAAATTSLEVKVLQANGTPATGANVTLFPGNGWRIEYRDDAWQPDIQSADGSGVAVFDCGSGVKESAARVLATLGDAAASTLTKFDDPMGPLTLRLEPGIVVRGRVLDETGSGVAGATVTLHVGRIGQSGWGTPSLRVSGTSGGGGAFVLPPIPVNSLAATMQTMEAMAPGCVADSSVTVWKAAADVPADVELRVVRQ